MEHFDPLKFIADNQGMHLVEALAKAYEQGKRDAQEEWIPVSKRMPKVRHNVILSTKDWSSEGCYWETTEHHVIWKGYRWNATYWDDEVIAWKPLPEPYRGEQE